MSNRAGDGFQNLFGFHLQLVLHMQVAGGDHHVDAPTGGRLQGLGTAVNIHLMGAAQARNGACLDDLGDLANRFEVAIGGDGETGLNDIDPHLFQDLGQFELFIQAHGGTGRLLAVAHGGVKDDDIFARLSSGYGGRINGSGHVSCSWRWSWTV